MQNCLQTEGQSIYQHGVSVKEHYFKLLFLLRNNQMDDVWRLPEWLFIFRDQILENLISDDIMEEYLIFHDCSKPYCKIIDSVGKVHFPDHAKKSAELWMSIGGSFQASQLMKMDMDIHLLKSNDVLEFSKRKESISLLLSGLSEIHSNSKLFGGIDSVSFKIKYKQIEKRGHKICKILFA